MADFPMPTNDDGLKIAQLQQNLENAQRQIDDIVRLLQPYNADIIYAFDAGGNPVGYQGLTTRAGGWPGISIPQISRPFLSSDVSAGGSTGLITVSSGVIDDVTNSDVIWGSGPNPILIDDPFFGSVPFNVEVGSAGPPSTLRFPFLALSSSATVLYLHSSIDSTTGFITGVTIEADSGSGMPGSDDGNWYTLITNLFVTITSGVATVAIGNDGIQSSLYFAICGFLPLTDGTKYRSWT